MLVHGSCQTCWNEVQPWTSPLSSVWHKWKEEEVSCRSRTNYHKSQIAHEVRREKRHWSWFHIHFIYVPCNMILSRPQCKFTCHLPAFSASFPHCCPLSHLWGKHSCFWPSPTNHNNRISFLPDFSVPHFYDKEHCCDCCTQKEFLTDWYCVDKEMPPLLTLPYLALFLRTHVQYIQL